MEAADLSRASPAPRTMRALIDAAARTFGDATVLISLEGGARRSFVDLRAGAERCARRLAGLGLERGDTVGLALDNGLAVAELMFGAMYGGFVPVPLDIGAGPAKLTPVLANAAPRVIFVADAHREAIAASAAGLARTPDLIGTDTDAGPRWDGAASGELLAVMPDDDAFLIYTSGSTGQPRGACFSHAQVAAMAPHSVEAHQLTAADRFLCVLPLYHLNSVEKLFGVLVGGGAMLLPRHFSVPRFWEWMSEQHCTWSALVPTLVAQLLRFTDPRADGRSLADVRFMRCSSAPLAVEQHRAFEARFGVPLLQGMGMSEAGYIFSNPLPPAERKPGAIGLPYRFEARVVDASGRALPDGEVGEIVVRGPAVMRGYRNDPAATAAAIDPGGWLHTGDQGYRDADGYYFIAGRLKELIIKGGVNVAPREIDEALESHPDVLEAAAVGVPDPVMGEEIVAYVVLRAGATVAPHELIARCEQRLGAFRAPARIAVLDALPKGPSGKVQRLALRDRHRRDTADHGPLDDTRATVESPRPPRTPLEAIIATGWAELLELETLDVHAHFFALGGSSLLAVQILSRLRQRLPVDLSLRMFFEHPTVAEQARIVGTALAAAVARPAPPSAASLAQRATLEQALLAALAAAHPSPPAADRPAEAALLKPVRPDCTAPPLFCVYGPSQYGELAESLAPERPVYALFVEREAEIVLGTERDGDAFLSVEALARFYLDGLRRAQPRGPYRLAGFSFGGRVALEMAQQLLAEGDEVALLAALDTYLPGAFHWRPLPWLAHRLREAVGGLAPPAVPNANERSDAPAAAAAPARLVADMIAREEAYRHAANTRHVPRPYPGRVVLCIAAEPLHLPGQRTDRLRGWGAIAIGGLEVHEIAGDHYSMLRHPTAADVGRCLLPHLGG